MQVTRAVICGGPGGRTADGTSRLWSLRRGPGLGLGLGYPPSPRDDGSWRRGHSLGKSLSQVYHDRRFLSAAPQALVQRHGSKQAGKEMGADRPRLPTALGSRGAGPGRRRAGGGDGGGLAWPRRTGPGLSLAVPHSA